jgi:hypothetical protein
MNPTCKEESTGPSQPDGTCKKGFLSIEAERNVGHNQLTHTQAIAKLSSSLLFSENQQSRLQDRSTGVIEYFQDDIDLSAEPRREEADISQYENYDFHMSDCSLEVLDLIQDDPDTPITPPSSISLHMSLATLEEKAKSVPRSQKKKVKISIQSVSSFQERIEAYESQCGISFPSLDYTHEGECLSKCASSMQYGSVEHL